MDLAALDLGEFGKQLFLRLLEQTSTEGNYSIILKGNLNNSMKDAGRMIFDSWMKTSLQVPTPLSTIGMMMKSWIRSLHGSDSCGEE